MNFTGSGIIFVGNGTGCIAKHMDFIAIYGEFVEIHKIERAILRKLYHFTKSNSISDTAGTVFTEHQSPFGRSHTSICVNFNGNGMGGTERIVKHLDFGGIYEDFAYIQKIEWGCSNISNSHKI